MCIKSRLAAAIYRAVIGIIAALSSWSIFLSYGADAWHQFATWALILVAVYYICSALATAIMSKRRNAGWSFLPTWQLAALIAAGLVLAEQVSGFATSGQLADEQASLIIQFALPIMIMLDWLAFSKKGQFRTIDPWYALALPVCYLAWEIMTIGDFNSINVTVFIWWVVFMMVVILIFGYLIYLLDLIMSGKLSQYIVMPKIKVIELVDEEDSSSPQASLEEAKTEEKVSTPTSKNPTSPKPKKPAKETTKMEIKEEKVHQSVEVHMPETPPEPKEPTKPSVPQIENRKKDSKSAQNLHRANKRH